jgi:hypothetical protein
MIRRLFAIVLVVFGSLALVAHGQTFDGSKRARALSRGGKARASDAARKKAEDVHLVRELQHAHRVLSAADPVYNGHRARALSEINHAIGNLEKEMHARGLKDHAKHTRDVPKSVSHAMVATTGDALVTVLSQLTSMQRTTNRTRAAGHVKRAISEVHQALAHVGHKHTPKNRVTARK